MITDKKFLNWFEKRQTLKRSNAKDEARKSVVKNIHYDCKEVDKIFANINESIVKINKIIERM